MSKAQIIGFVMTECNKQLIFITVNLNDNTISIGIEVRVCGSHICAMIPPSLISMDKFDVDFTENGDTVTITKLQIRSFVQKHFEHGYVWIESEDGELNILTNPINININISKNLSEEINNGVWDPWNDLNKYHIETEWKTI